MMRCVDAWSESHGGHFEQLLYAYSFSYNSQSKCFRTHVDMNIFFLFWYAELLPRVCPHLSVTLRITAGKCRFSSLVAVIGYLAYLVTRKDLMRGGAEAELLR
jgi:hypothetical protein